MPKIASSILWPIVVLIIAFGAFFLKPWETKTTETISVTAAGTVDVTPDVAKLKALKVDEKDSQIQPGQNQLSINLAVDFALR